MTREENEAFWGRLREEYVRSDLSLKKLAEKLTTIPSWAETCRQREAAAKAGKKKK